MVSVSCPETIGGCLGRHFCSSGSETDKVPRFLGSIGYLRVSNILEESRRKLQVLSYLAYP